MNLIPQLLATRPKGIIYISCNPVSLAKDVKPALSAGYEIRKLALFDMFPQTSHVETFCLLTR